MVVQVVNPSKRSIAKGTLGATISKIVYWLYPYLWLSLLSTLLLAISLSHKSVKFSDVRTGTSSPQTPTAASPLEETEQYELKIPERSNLGKIFRELKLPSSLVVQLLKIPEATSLQHLRPGRRLTLIVTTKEHNFRKLHYEIDATHDLEIISTDGKQFHAEITTITPQEFYKTAHAKINRSIYVAAHEQGLSPRLTAQLIEVFSGLVNFRQLVAKDQFTVLYRELWSRGKPYKSELLAAELTHSGNTYQVIGFADPQGKLNFYTPDGHGVKPAFTRYPITFSRVSSRFSRNRRHPILGIARPHLGIDLVAPKGTPIYAPGNGTVTFVGVKNGYGRTIIIKHSQKYSTLYAHLSHFATNRGKEVKRGELIGYVGSTGLATNPHLHYEFLVNGVQQDPAKVALPKDEWIPETQKKAFANLAAERLQELKKASVVPLK